MIIVLFRSAEEIRDYLNGLPAYGEFEEPRPEDNSRFALNGRIVETTNPEREMQSGQRGVTGSRAKFFIRLKKLNGKFRSDIFEMRRHACFCADCLGGSFCDDDWTEHQLTQ